MILPFCVYVLYSELDEQLYMGFTTNLENRLAQHQDGNVKSTKARRPFRLIFCEFYPNKNDALRREKYFKTTSGKRSLYIMLNEWLFELDYHP